MNFMQIATPHEDIQQGNLTMDVYAASLSQVVSGNAPPDYSDVDLFFRKTYFTRGLNNILRLAEERLKGKTGDSVIQLQTPFGGGKTHTLISLYHSAKKWDAKVVVFDGVAFSPKDTKPWEEIERQLIGNIELTKGNFAPGSDNLIKILRGNAPVLILMDEVLEYITKAAAVRVGDSNLASQTFAFIQELTQAVSAVGNALLVMTLPSSMLEHYDENAERMYQQLQKVTGRVEKIYTPVEDEEIENVIRKRLFRSIDEKKAKEVVDKFVEHIKTERLLTQEEALHYRKRFLKSYPFKPEVIETLYKKWGTFSTFQRTRGVLRLLSLVINSLLNSNIPFIRLGDFDLNRESIRRELVKHIGLEWDGIIAQDITDDDSGAKKIDEALSVTCKPYKLGTVVSTTIFLNSFSGKGTVESSIKEIKLSTLYPEINASEIDNVINQIREKLFYIADEGLYFTNQANLNRIIVVREETVSKERVMEEEVKIVNGHILGDTILKVYVYPHSSRDIPDNGDLKLIITDQEKPDNDLFDCYGEQPRVYKNTLFFLCRNDNMYDSFLSYLRKLLALYSIEKDGSLKLTDVQKQEVKAKLKNLKDKEYEEIRKIYRTLFLPVKNGFREIDMGVPTYGEKFIDKEVFAVLKTNGEILEKVSPKVICERYLKNADFVDVKNLFNAFLKTPGELRLLSERMFVESVNAGVRDEIFGLGILKDGEVELVNGELVDLEEGKVITKEIFQPEPRKHDEIDDVGKNSSDYDERSVGECEEIIAEPSESYEGRKEYNSLFLRLDVPVQNFSTVARVANYLKEKFENISIKVDVSVENGKISEDEYGDKVLEAFYQAKIEVEKEEKN